VCSSFTVLFGDMADDFGEIVQRPLRVDEGVVHLGSDQRTFSAGTTRPAFPSRTPSSMAARVCSSSSSTTGAGLFNSGCLFVATTVIVGRIKWQGNGNLALCNSAERPSHFSQKRARNAALDPPARPPLVILRQRSRPLGRLPTKDLCAEPRLARRPRSRTWATGLFQGFWLGVGEGATLMSCWSSAKMTPFLTESLEKIPCVFVGSGT